MSIDNLKVNFIANNIMESKSLSEYELLMDKADPDNTGKALNLITYDKEKGKWIRSYSSDHFV